MLLTQEIDFALSRAFVRAGRSIPARIAMIAITIKSSIRVKTLAFIPDVRTEEPETGKQSNNGTLEHLKEETRQDRCNASLEIGA